MSTPRKQRRTPSKSKILPPLYTPQEVKANGYSPRKATIQGSATSPQSARQQGGSGRKASTGSTAASTLSARKLRGSPRKGGTETSPQVAGQQLETSRRNSTTIPLFAAQPEKEQASGSRRPSAGRTAPSRRPAQFADQTPGSLKRAQESPIEESPPKRVASDNLQSHTKHVHIYVGDDKRGEPLVIYRSLLFRHSPYFKRAFEIEEHTLFVSDEMPSVVYKDTTRDIFRLFRRYIYRGVIQGSDTSLSVGELIKVWVLAGKISTPEVQNNVLREIFEHGSTISIGGMVYIYKTTEPGSPLKRFVVDQMIRRHSTEKLESLIKDDFDVLPKALLADLAIVQKKLLTLKGSLPACKVEDYYV